MNVIRQGDLTLIRIPDGSADVSTDTKPAGTRTLAVGEQSAHSHVVDNALFNAEAGVLCVLEPSQLRVEPPAMAWRHDAIDLPPGDYRLVVQREYTPEEIRNVAD